MYYRAFCWLIPGGPSQSNFVRLPTRKQYHSLRVNLNHGDGITSRSPPSLEPNSAQLKKRNDKKRQQNFLFKASPYRDGGIIRTHLRLAWIVCESRFHGGFIVLGHHSVASHADHVVHLEHATDTHVYTRNVHSSLHELGKKKSMTDRVDRNYLALSIRIVPLC